MYQTKNRIYPDFDKTQKSGVCNFLRALVKQNVGLDSNNILEKFLEEQRYYLEINSSRFPFLENYIDNYDFLKDTQDYINACIKYYEYKEKQKPILEANKAFEKKKKKFLQEVKMSKEPATKKQLYYYKRLCKKYSIEMENTEELSKLDAKNKIERILNEHSENYKQLD